MYVVTFFELSCFVYILSIVSFSCSWLYFVFWHIVPGSVQPITDSLCRMVQTHALALTNVTAQSPEYGCYKPSQTNNLLCECLYNSQSDASIVTPDDYSSSFSYS